MARQFLTRKRVVAAGRRVAETEGVGGLTIRRVAVELGATPMAMYRHVKDKRELILALLDDVAEGLPRLPGQEGAPPGERIVEAFTAIDAYLARHVWVVEILRQGELFAPRAVAIFSWTIDRFAELGLDERRATDAYAALWWFTLGHLSYLPSTAPERRQARAEQVMKVVGESDQIRRTLREFDHEAAFAAGLRGLVSALTAR
jgi:AcrR family transcriptional regulator